MEKVTTNAKGITTPAVTVCVGSACHLRGSYEIIEFLKQALKTHQLEEQIILKGCFCMEKCTEGVNVKVGQEVFSVASVDEMREIFDKKIVKQIESSGKEKDTRETNIHC